MENLDRLKDIVNFINKKKRITTKELSEKFGVTEQTVRSDLALLEREHKIIRVHGGAKAIDTDISFDERLEENVPEKRRLGEYAASLVEEGDIIFLDGGTSMMYLIDALPKEIHLRIITASLPIADKCSQLINADIYCLGGMLNKRTKEMYGPRAVADAETLMANKAFIGVSGFSVEDQFTENNVLSLDVKSKILNSTKQKIVVADSKKENRIGIQRAFTFSDFELFNTGKKVSSKFISEIRKHMEVIQK